MTLPGFIEKALAHFATVEKFLAAQDTIKANADTITELTAKLEAVEAEKAKLIEAAQAGEAKAKELADKIAAAEKAEKDLAEKKAELEKSANLKALEIEAKRGSPPVADQPNSGDVLEQLNAITNHSARQAFFNKNRTAIMRAWKQNRK